MSNDLEVIESLKKEGIELEEVKELEYWNGDEGYILNENIVIQLSIYDRIVSKKIFYILSKLINLKYLYLKSNQITTIPDSLSNLSNLEYLDLNSNQIHTFLHNKN